MSKSYQDNNLAKLFETLKPQQRLVNILFDEVKLKKAMRFTGGHVVGQAANKPEELATSALVIDLICHYGGPRNIIRIIPVACLKSYQLKEMLLEAAYAVRKDGGYIISFICDNCPLNQQTYIQLNGPGRVYLQPDGLQVFLVYDFIHIFKNIRNNWFTEKLKELSFTVNNKEYVASWNDVTKLYHEDKQNPIRLTKLSYRSVHPKPLQRQSVPLVCQLSNDKTHAAFSALQGRFNLQGGTPVFIHLITQWFKMMDVKEKSSCSRLKDESRAPWSDNCRSFDALQRSCEVISSCKWTGGRERKKKLTKFTAEAFVFTTINNIAASKYLLENYDFQYILPSIFLKTL